MPTAYTAPVADGTVTDLRTFALRCAHAFVNYDTPLDSPLQQREPSAYRAQELAKATARLAALNMMSLDEAITACDAAEAEANADDARYAANRAETRVRYEAMLAAVHAWAVPTDLDELKRLMVSQINECIRVECADLPPRYRPEIAPEIWLAQEKHSLAQSIAHLAGEIEADHARCARENAWIDALYASLPAPEKP